MDSIAVGWLVNTARRNLWRVPTDYTLEDLVQDGYLVYYRVSNKYPDVTEPRHLMRLFQVSFNNHINTLSKKRTRVPLLCASDLCTTHTDESKFWDAVLDHADPQELSVMLHNAPPLVRQALSLYLDDKTCSSMRSRYRVRKDGTRETLNERMCRLLGVESCDLVGMIKKFLTS